MRRLRESLGTLTEVFRNPNLRRIQLAFAGSIVGQFAFSIALAIYAYRLGGPTAVGLLVVVRTVPAALASPFTSIVADRLRRERVMLACDLVRAAAVAGAATSVAAGGPAAVVYVVAALVGVVSTVFRPAVAALLPSLARSPEELAAANVSSSSIESVGCFAGPAIGGLVVAAASVQAAFALTAATFVWSAILILRLRVERPDAAAPPEPARIHHELLAGFRTLAAEPKLRVIVGLYTAQTVVAGGLTVLVVVVALRVLALGSAWVGYLNAAIGVGGLVGAAIALVLVGYRRLAGVFGSGVVLWGLPLMAVGIWPRAGVALAMLGLLGIGNTLVDVSALTLLQRSVPDQVLARVFGVVEGLTVGAMALGAVVTPALIAGLGTRSTLVIVGAFLPACAALCWPGLARIDREARVPERQLGLLRAIPIFAPLPPPTLEHLAGALREVHVPAGADVVRAGEPGTEFFVVGSGRAEVLLADESVPVEPGGFFGEIALLRDVPRTATVRAVTDLTLYTLGRDEFVGAVTGYAPSRDVADTLIAERLGSWRIGIVPG
jgi:MFS family permease